MSSIRALWIKKIPGFLIIGIAGLLLITCGGGGGGGSDDNGGGGNNNGTVLSDYNGNYYGTYSGTESGDWCLQVADGNISGLAWNSYGEFHDLAGSVSVDGSMVVGTADQYTRFVGTITKEGVMSGTWTYTPDPSENGSYHGQHGDCPYGDTAQIEEIQTVLETVTVSAEEGSQAADAVETAEGSSGDIPVDEALQANTLPELLNALTGETACGTITRSGNTLVYTASNGQSCVLKSGTVTITNIQLTATIISATATFDKVVTQKCSLDGRVDVQLTENGSGQLIVTVNLINLKTCSGTMNGTVTAVYEETNMSFVSGTAVFNATYVQNGQQVAVSVNLAYNSAGGISGTADLTVANTNYHCVLTNIVIDKTCGVPTAGTLTITSNTLSSPVTFNFSGTTCANPTATAMVEGKSIKFTL